MAFLICPHCERKLDSEHDKKACADFIHRKSSRRIFLGALLGGIAAAIAPKPKSLFQLTAEYIEASPRFQFGFTGFKEVQAGIGIAGEFLWAGNVVHPRTAFKVINFDGGKDIMNCLIYPSKQVETDATS